MTELDAFRRLVADSPAEGLVTVPASWCRAIVAALGAPPDPGAAPTPPDLTAAEFGLRFGRRASTVRTWCEQGRIAGAWKLNGKAWMIPEASIDQFRQQQGAQRPAVERPSTGGLGDWRRRQKPA